MSFNLREKIYIKYKKLRVRSTPFVLPASLSQARNFLVCLPRKRQHLLYLVRQLEFLRSLFPQALFSFSCDSHLIDLLDGDRVGYRILRLNPDSLGFFSNPKGSFLRSLYPLKAEVAMDLDFEENLTNALICLESGAPLRLGGEKKLLGLPFYNFVIATKGKGDEYHSSLDVFLRTIADLAQAGAAHKGSEV